MCSSEQRLKDTSSNVWFQKISIPSPWKVTGNSRGVGDIEVQISKVCGSEKSNIFPEGPRTLSDRNLPISHLRFINQQINEAYFSVLKCNLHIKWTFLSAYFGIMI